MSKVWIGTSGWTYDGWRGPFYPTDLTKTKWLCWYSSQFPTTEINGSFYRTPSLKAVAAWRDQTPKDFFSRGRRCPSCHRILISPPRRPRNTNRWPL